MLIAQVEQAAQMFRETDLKYGLGVAVLVTVLVFGGLAFWRFGLRLMASHDRFIDATIETGKAQAKSVEEIRVALPTLCKADCPDSRDCENYRKRKTG